MKKLIFALTSLLCLQTLNATSEEAIPDVQEREVIFANFLGKTLEHEKSNRPAQYLRNDKILFQVTAFPAKEIDERQCRDFILIDFSESEAGREKNGTACKKSAEIWYPING